MSLSQPLSPVAGAVAPSAWRKVAIWGAVAVVVLLGLLFFSGKLNLHIFSKVQPNANQNVQMSAAIAPLVRPLEAPPPPPPPHIADPRPSPQLPANPIADAERQKAFASPIAAYRAQLTPAPAKAATTGAIDPETGGPMNPLEASLVPTKIDGTKVAELPNPRWLIEQGRVLPCIQQTKINSTLPGAVTAIIPVEIRGETGDVVLLPKGAKVFGTITQGLLNGLDRIAVLWQNITTPVLYDRRGMPHQFRINVASPAASEMGETGLDGDVNRHLVKKIGGIIGMSLLRGGIDAAVQTASKNNGNGNTSINFNQFQSPGDTASEALLRSWIAIPDIITRDAGLACSLFIVRDLEMRQAYTLTQQYEAR